MRLHVTDRRPCRLERGDLRRVPQNPLSGVVGYHLCCLRCGFVTVALNGSDEPTHEQRRRRIQRYLTWRNRAHGVTACPLSRFRYNKLDRH